MLSVMLPLVILLGSAAPATPPPPPTTPQTSYESNWKKSDNHIEATSTRTTQGTDDGFGGSSGDNNNGGSGGGNNSGGGNYNQNIGYDERSDGYYIPSGPRTVLDQFCLSWTSLDECIGETYPDATPEELEEITAIPAITITDLARFAPAGTPLSGEPENLGVVGLPTNFVAAASTQTQSGELFDFPIQVRFTPATYTFHYGDGSTDSGSDGGASWDALGQAQFTPTGTSHTYSERGTYDARVDVSYTAEIDLGGGWFSVAGQLDTTGPTQQIRIFEAHTALVANTCAERPTARGC